MPLQHIEVPILSATFRAIGAPLSLVNRAGDFVYVSGLPPYSATTGLLVTGDIRTQATASLTALLACLAAADATADQVVNIRVYAANVGHYSAINEVYRNFFPEHGPTRTFVPVASWFGEFDLEIDCVAYTG
jgi:2-iminobutanoate/2-iminopropanoate deaminase